MNDGTIPTASVMYVGNLAEIERLEQFLQQDNVGPLSRSLTDRSHAASSIGGEVSGAGELGGSDLHEARHRFDFIGKYMIVQYLWSSIAKKKYCSSQIARLIRKKKT
jgi:hypothetical protein